MHKAKQIKVLIVDDHSMVRRGLAAILKNYPEFQVIGEARDGNQAMALCARNQPDVILMDLKMPELDGVATTRKILQKWSEIRVIALTSFLEKELVQDALQAGAIGYLLKNISGEALAEAIHAAYTGKPALSHEALISLVQSDPEPKPGKDLTKREVEVLGELVKGFTNPEIAVQLSISKSTVKSHISSILSKLGVSHRAEAIALAIKHNIVNHNR